jgi:hypothetical protein
MRRSQRLLIAALVGGALLIALGSVAGAQTYATGMSLDPQSAAPGTQIAVRASGLRPNVPVQVLFDSVPIATTEVDANGVAHRDVVIPTSASEGEHMVTIAKETDTPPTSASSAPAVLLQQSITVATGGDAFHHDDGPPVNALTIAGFIIVATTVPLLLLRRRRAASR